MRRAGWIALGSTLAVVALAAWHFDPLAGQSTPACGFRALTGHRCPGCGSTHALYHLIHGRFHEAWNMNALVLLAPPLMGLQWTLSRRWPHMPAPLAPGGLLFWALLASIFGVVRELH